MIRSHPWLTVGIISGTAIAVGIALFFAGTQTTANGPNPFAGLTGIGLLAMLVGFPGLGISMISGAIRISRRKGWIQKVLASIVMLVAVPTLIYGVFLILSAVGIINPI